jgi:hypothetical protein
MQEHFKHLVMVLTVVGAIPSTRTVDINAVLIVPLLKQWTMVAKHSPFHAVVVAAAELFNVRK